MKYDHLLLVAVGIIAVFIIGVSLHHLGNLLLPFTFALLLSLLFQPLLLGLKRRRVPVGIGLLAVLTILGALLGMVGALLYASSESLITDLPSYEAKLSKLMAHFTGSLNGLIGKFGLHLEQLEAGQLLGVTTVTAAALSSVLGTVFSFVGDLALMLLFMLFMLAGSGQLRAKLERAYPASADRINNALVTIGSAVRKYLGIQVLLAAGVGLVTGLILWVIGVDFALFWGCLAFVASFVPYVGVVIAVAVPFLFSLLQFDALTQPALVLVLLGALQFVTGNIINPKLMSSGLNLSLLLVLFALMFWGLLWGPWGMILAVPITVSIRIALANIDGLQPLSILMSQGVKQKQQNSD